MNVGFQSLAEEFKRYERRKEQPPPSRIALTPILKRLGCRNPPPEDMVRLNDLMATAGEALFNSVRLAAVRIEPEPEWIRDNPEMPCVVPNAEEGYVDDGILCFDTYWWCSLVVLSHQQPDAGIVMPTARMFYAHFRPCFTRIEFLEAMRRDHGNPDMSEDERLHVNARAVPASIAACRFFARPVAASRPGEVPEKHKKNRRATGVDHPGGQPQVGVAPNWIENDSQRAWDAARNGRQLTGWNDIVAALGLDRKDPNSSRKNNRRRHVRNMSRRLLGYQRRYGGPITQIGRRSTVDEGSLRMWWETIHRQADTAELARNERAAPYLDGREMRQQGLHPVARLNAKG